MCLLAAASVSLLVGGAGAALIAAASQPEAVAPGDPPALFPAAGEGSKRYVILAEASEIRIHVMRAGPLARLGHNHIIGGPAVRGELWLADKLPASGFALVVDVTELEVDRPAWRRDAGAEFSRQPDKRDIEGTRRNMLGPKVLDADRHPTIELEAIEVRGALPDLVLITRFTVRGQTHTAPVAVRLGQENSLLVAEGEFTLLQSDFGIKPFSVLLGSLRVQDEVRVAFRIVAEVRP